MKIETKEREDHQMQVIAEFENSTLDQYKHQAARRVSGKAKIPGFRPGKAPYDVILRLYGEAAIEDEAIELFVDSEYPRILNEAKVEPAAPGKLENVDKGDRLKFTFVIPMEPTVDLTKYKDVRKKYTLTPVSKKDIDEFIERLKQNYATAEPVERPAQKGDLVYLKLDGKILNPAADQKAELLTDSPLQVVIGETDPETARFPYIGFGDNLLNLAAGDAKTIKYTYPQDAPYEQLRGKEVEFLARVDAVKTLHLPDLDDAFAQTVGDFDSVEKLLENVKSSLEARARDEYESEWFEDLIDDVVNQAVIKYPPQLIEHEMEHVVEAVQEDLARQKMELETYLKTIKKEKAAWLEDEIKPVAKKRLERSLVMEKLAKAEDIQIQNEDLQNEVSTMIQEMQMREDSDFKKLEKQLKNPKIANNFAMQAASRLVNRMVLDRLKAIATGEAAKATEEKPSESKPKAQSKKKAEAMSETPAEVKPKAAPKKKTAIVAEPAGETEKPKKVAKKAAADKQA